eukprot:363047-Chlamydomonas_euryale.AAC.3
MRHPAAASAAQRSTAHQHAQDPILTDLDLNLTHSLTSPRPSSPMGPHGRAAACMPLGVCTDRARVWEAHAPAATRIPPRSDYALLCYALLCSRDASRRYRCSEGRGQHRRWPGPG